MRFRDFEVAVDLGVKFEVKFAAFGRRHFHGLQHEHFEAVRAAGNGLQRLLDSFDTLLMKQTNKQTPGEN